MSKTKLAKDVLKSIEDIKSADLVIGVPSFRNADTIKHVVEASCAGAHKYFPYLKTVFVNSDGGSTDNTREVVLGTKIPAGIEKIVTPYIGIPGKGSAFRTIFETADRLRAKLVIVLDSDLRSVTPEWIKLFGEPIIKNNYGYVVPHYRRHKYDGTITNSIAYPLTRALYGLDIRQPIAGDFGITGALNKYFSHQDIYDNDQVAKFGIDIFMTTSAICEGFKIAQTHAGSKIHEAKDPAADLTPMFTQVVSTIFNMMKKYEIKWQTSDKVVDVWSYGKEIARSPETVNINFEALILKFLNGYEEHKEMIDDSLSRTNASAFRRIYRDISGLRAPRGRSAIDLLLDSRFNWARTVYDLAIKFNDDRFDLARYQEWDDASEIKQKVIAAMIPLYYLKVARFYARTKNYTHAEAEREILLEAREFEFERPYLVSKWMIKK